MKTPQSLAVLNCFDYYLPQDFFYEKIHCLDQYHKYIASGILTEVTDENNQIYFALDKAYLVPREPTDSEYATIVSYYQAKVQLITSYDTFVTHKYSLINLLYFAIERRDIEWITRLLNDYTWMLYKWEAPLQLTLITDFLKSRDISLKAFLRGYLEGLSNTEILWESKVTKKQLRTVIESRLLSQISLINAETEPLQRDDIERIALALNDLKESDAFILFAYIISNNLHQKYFGQINAMEITSRYVGFYRQMLTTALTEYLVVPLDPYFSDDPFYAYLYISYYFNRMSCEWTPEMRFEVNAFVDAYSRCIQLAKLLDKEADYFFMLFVAIITRFAQFKETKRALDVLVRVSSMAPSILTEEDHSFMLAVISLLSGKQTEVKLTGIYKTYFNAIENTLAPVTAADNQ
jgi:hypothetical protein